jgi:hypothetical protein
MMHFIYFPHSVNACKLCLIKPFWKIGEEVMITPRSPCLWAGLSPKHWNFLNNVLLAIGLPISHSAVHTAVGEEFPNVVTGIRLLSCLQRIRSTLVILVPKPLMSWASVSSSVPNPTHSQHHVPRVVIYCWCTCPELVWNVVISFCFWRCWPYVS